MSNGEDYRHVFRAWAPHYMQGEWGGRLLDAFGTLFNAMGERALDAHHSGNPLACETDALERLAAQRDIELYPTEPEASRRYRTARWWQLHRRKGTHLGQMANMQPYFLPGTLPKIRVVHQNVAGSRAIWWTRNPDGTVERYAKTPSNWSWQESITLPDGHWARSWCLIYTEGTPLDDCHVYDEAGLTYDGGAVYNGAGISGTQIKSDLIRMFKSWRTAHEQVWGLALVYDATKLSPTGSATTLADGSTTYPQSNWHYLVDPATGRLSRPNWIDFIYDRTRDGA